MTRTRKALGGLIGLAMALGVPAALVLGTSSPAQACFYVASRGDGPSCGGGSSSFLLTATPTTVVAGSPVTATLSINSTGTPMDVSAASTFSISSGSCRGNVCTPSAAGTVTITGVDTALANGTASTTVTVLPAPDHLAIELASPTITAGRPIAFTVRRAAPDGSTIDDVTSGASVALDGAACSSGSCTAPATPGSYGLIATYGSLTGTANVLVQAGPAARLVVTPGPGSWNNDSPLTFSAEAFDALGNDLGDVTGTTTFTVSPNGSCTGDLCTADTSGPHTVTATYLGITGSVTLDATAPAPTVVPLLLDATVGEPYTGTVLSFQDATSFAMLAPGSAPLPPGLGLAQPGVLTGTATAAGTYTFDVIGGDENGQQQKQVTITVEPGTQPTKPAVSISSTSVREGNSGRTPVTLTVRLSHASTSPVTVSWHTANGTAVAGKDYVAAHGTVTVPAGQLTATIQVSVIGDRIKEPNERFAVVVTNPHGATLGTARGTVTVVNDD